MTTNTNTGTGIRFGVIAANHVPYLYEDIIENGRNTTYEDWLREAVDVIASSLIGAYPGGTTPHTFREEIMTFFLGSDIPQTLWRDFVERYGPGWRGHANVKEIAQDLFDEGDYGEGEYMAEEECYEYEHPEGSRYSLSWLGGAALIWVHESPEVTWTKTCSPCCPGAGDLDNSVKRDEGTVTYAVPESWFDEDPADEDESSPYIDVEYTDVYVYDKYTENLFTKQDLYSENIFTTSIYVDIQEANKDVDEPDLVAILPEIELRHLREYEDWKEEMKGRDLNDEDDMETLCRDFRGSQAGEEWAESFFPVYNYMWPVTLRHGRYETVVADLLEKYAGNVSLVRYKENLYLALTGGGMDFTWEIAAGYLCCGQRPPYALVMSMPRMAGMTRESPAVYQVLKALVGVQEHLRYAATSLKEEIGQLNAWFLEQERKE